MPPWIQIVIALAAFVTALGVLWSKVFRPGAKLISTGEEMLPLMRQLTDIFKGTTPDSFATLLHIAMEFKGAGLSDVIGRLDAAATENKLAAEVLKLNVEVVKELAVQDRMQLARLLLVLDRLDIKVTAGAAAGVQRDALVAEDLLAARHRADAVHVHDPGAAADAASKSEPGQS